MLEQLIIAILDRGQALAEVRDQILMARTLKDVQK